MTRKYSSKRAYKFISALVKIISSLAVLLTLISYYSYNQFMGSLESVENYKTCIDATKDSYRQLPKTYQNATDEILARSRCLTEYVSNPMDFWFKVGVISFSTALLLPLGFYGLRSLFSYIYPNEEISD